MSWKSELNRASKNKLVCLVDRYALNLLYFKLSVLIFFQNDLRLIPNQFKKYIIMRLTLYLP